MFKKRYTPHVETNTTAKFLNLILNDNVTFSVDLQTLLDTPIDSKEAWVDITPILTAYNVKLKKWVKNKNVRDYINVVNDRFLNNCKGCKLKSITPLSKSKWYTKKSFGWLNNDCPLICDTKDKTYIHRNLFIKFITMLDVKIDIALHEMGINIIKNATATIEDESKTVTFFE